MNNASINVLNKQLASLRDKTSCIQAMVNSGLCNASVIEEAWVNVHMARFDLDRMASELALLRQQARERQTRAEQ